MDKITFGDCTYAKTGPDSAVLYECLSKNIIFEVPRSIKDEVGKEYFIYQIKYQYFDNSPAIIIQFPHDSLVREICDNSFQNSHVEMVFIPPSVSKIGPFAFFRSFAHPTIEVYLMDENKYFCDDGCAIYKISKMELLICNHTKRFTIRESVTKILTNCFYCSKLRYIHIPASVEIIGSNSFSFCINLSRITFANDSKLRIIEEYSFFGAPIKKIYFPKSVECIGIYAFTHCMIERIYFPLDSCLEKIGEAAFFQNQLIEVIFPKSIKTIGINAFCMNRYLKKIVFNKETQIKSYCDTAFDSSHQEYIKFI